MVYVFLADGFETIEALIPVDLMRRAGIDVVTVGVTGKTVLSTQNVRVEADITLDDARFDASLEGVILPGGGLGTQNLDKSEGVRALTKRAYDNGLMVAAICAAPSVLGHMGLLSDREAVCYPGFERELGCRSIPDAFAVTDGNIITSAGAGSATEFAFHIITYLRGEQAAQRIREQIILCY